MPMVSVAFIVNHREIGPAKALASWIAELGGVQDFDCVLCLTKPAERINAEGQIKPILEKAFGSVTTYVPYDEVEVPWPNSKVDARSPNHMFKRVSQEFENKFKKPFLWLEMDAVPLKPSWMKELDREYEKCAKPFMGVRLLAGDRPYMSGVAIYPANITRCTPLLRNPGMNQHNGQIPFDVYAGLDTTRLMHETDLIQYVKPSGDLEVVADWSLYKEPMTEKAVLYHRSKDLSLISHLRGGPNPILIPTPTPEPPPPVTKNWIHAPTAPPHKLVLLDFDATVAYHVSALTSLATDKKRGDVLQYLVIAGLVPKLPRPQEESDAEEDDGILDDVDEEGEFPIPDNVKAKLDLASIGLDEQPQQSRKSRKAVA